ncbi:2,4-dienoyl-CoA reductase [Mycobacterium talmoniae]|uniref:2,4-dienoyl-CoA reductase n=2 Tax=Mycobacterium talmoniae TaxID=1858794 RepID=A0A1S1NSW9_9MYCO|nr:2,4-dienoyl-CoA reductase [Mycobacterium talmoniae]
MEHFSHLLSPIQLGRVEIRNRVVLTSHGASETFRNPLASPDAYIEYLRRRAGAGVGLIITQPVLSDPAVGIPEATLQRHAALADAVRAEGAVLLLQVTHLGVYARTDADLRRGPLPGFQNSQSAMGETAHAMTDDEIEAMIEGYRRTAEMAVAAGFDGVEVHGAHGYLVQQSLTPSFNSREDRWGADRTLFVRSVLEVVRETIGPDRILGYRTPTDDLRSAEDGGLGAAGIVEVVQALLKTDQIDVLNTTIGDGGPSYARAIPSYRYDEAPNIPPLVKMREALGVTPPVIGVGRILSVGFAESLLAAGRCDLVAMTRAHIADPDLLVKARAGQTHRIRPCVGANVCVNRKLQGFSEISCFHNPQVLRERALEPHRTDVPRRVLVVGAGPAGLKAAATAAVRGHDVTIIEAAARPGGLLRSAERTEARGLVGSVDHLVSELGELRVTVQVATAVDAALLRAAAPDHVVLATGGRFVGASLFPDAAPGLVLSSQQALAGEVGTRVLIYDTVGANEGALVAEALAKRGKRVTFVTSCETVMPWGGALHRAEVLPILHKRTEQIVTSATVGDIDGTHVIVVRSDGDTLAEVDVDTVVAVCPPSPVTDLAPALEDLGIVYRVVGDALAPRGATHAFKEGHEAALAI